MSNLQPNCCLEFDFRKVDQHAGGKWLIHDTKRRKDNQSQSLKLPCRISKLIIKSGATAIMSKVPKHNQSTNGVTALEHT